MQKSRISQLLCIDRLILFCSKFASNSSTLCMRTNIYEYAYTNVESTCQCKQFLGNILLNFLLNSIPVVHWMTRITGTDTVDAQYAVQIQHLYTIVQYSTPAGGWQKQLIIRVEKHCVIPCKRFLLYIATGPVQCIVMAHVHVYRKYLYAERAAGSDWDVAFKNIIDRSCGYPGGGAKSSIFRSIPKQ